ncbi:LPS assembly lipoprotein LptE [Lentisphaerota bacterium WC36G]|nr:LPS assembly lipoprotein LptE [Lentisphaerae bacterium WC36]
MTLMTMKFIKFFNFTAALSLLLFLNGCGYHIGSINHPQFKSLAIAPVTNETLTYNASSILRGKLTEKCTVFSNLKLKSQKTADAILYCKILKITTREIVDTSTDNQEIFRPAEWELVMEVEYSILIPGRKRPLIDKRIVVGRSNFQYLGDYTTSKRNGINQASQRLATKIINQATEAW